MIKRYVEDRKESRSFFDLDRYAFGSEIDDSDIKKAFARRFTELEEKPDLLTMLRSLKDSLTEEKITELATIPTKEYADAFKAVEGSDLRLILAGALQFDRIINASPNMREISRRARGALKLIGAESPINARRVAKFGVRVDSKEP